MSHAARAPQPRDNRVVTFRGRNYARFSLENQIHCLPIDEPQERNFDQVNSIINELLGRPILPRINLNSLDDPWVLDCGFGNGAWIDSVLSDNTSTTVVGVDIYTGSGQLGNDSDDDDDDEGPYAYEWIRKRWNMNAPFRDLRDNNLRPETFNLINCRFLADGINANRWLPFVRELKTLLEPGGWLQVVEVSKAFQSDSGRLDYDNSWLSRWWQWYQQSLVNMNKNPRIGQEVAAQMREAGFEQIHNKVVQLPIGIWKDGYESVGAQALELVTGMIESMSAWYFLRLMRPPMPPEQYEALIQGAKLQLREPRLKLYMNVHVVYARRPERR